MNLIGPNLKTEILVIWSQVKALAFSNLKARYRRTAAGFFWVILNPTLNYLVQLLVFDFFLKIRIENYPLFLLTGLLPWLFISQSLEMCTSIFVIQGRLIRSLAVHPIVYLLAQILENLFNFIAVLLFLLVPILVMRGGSWVGLIWLPWAIFNLVLMVGAISWILATLQVFMRDTRYLVSFGLNVVFFLTPVFYPVTLVPDRFRFLILLNPLHHLIEPFRLALHHLEPRRLVPELALGTVISWVLLIFAGLLWGRQQNEVSLHV